MSDVMNTMVSNVGSMPPQSAGSPGAGAPASGATVAHAALFVIGAGAVSLVGIGYAFRRSQGGPLAPLRVDAFSVLTAYFSWLVVDAPLKALAYKYHGHPLAQAYLLVA